MKRWFRELADATNAAAEARGREPISRGEFELAWTQFIRAWGDRTAADFERFKEVALYWREHAYERLPDQHTSEAVDNEWIEAMNNEFGLMLSEHLWFLWWRSGKPPDKAERRAA